MVVVDALLSPESADLEDSPSGKLPSCSGGSWSSSALPESLRTSWRPIGFAELQISKYGLDMLVGRGVPHTQRT